MSEEEVWEPMKPVIRRLSSRRIAQIWLHHTGHDHKKSFGTKTREWELDTVMSLTRPRDESSTNVLEDDRGSILMEFTKARLRKPATRDQFATRLIYRSDEE